MTHIWTDEEMIQHQENNIGALCKPYGFSVCKLGPDRYVIMGDKGRPFAGSENNPLSLSEAVSLTLVECPPVGERYERPDAPPPEEVCSDPEGEAYELGEMKSRQQKAAIVDELLRLANIKGPVGVIVAEALCNHPSFTTDESVDLAKAIVGVLMERRSGDEIPF